MPRKPKNSTLFLLTTILLYGVLFFFNRDLALATAGNFWSMLLKIVPLLLVIYPVMIVVNMIFSGERTAKYLGGSSGMKSWIYASVGGILVSGPPYILYPMLGELKKKGMSNSLLAVFLFNRNVKIPFIPALVYYFGSEYTIVLSLYIIIFSIFNGILVGKLSGSQ